GGDELNHRRRRVDYGDRNIGRRMIAAGIRHGDGDRVLAVADNGSRRGALRLDELVGRRAIIRSDDARTHIRTVVWQSAVGDKLSDGGALMIVGATVSATVKVTFVLT